MNAIARELDTNRTKVCLVIDKTFSFGIEKVMKVLQGGERNRVIDEVARSSVIKIACPTPSDLGYTYEVWTNRLLTEYIRKKAHEDYGLKHISSTLQKCSHMFRLDAH